MALTNKKSFKKLWELIEPHFQTHKSKSVELDDIEFSIGWNRTTYLMLHLNAIDVFFVIDADDATVTIVSHKRLTTEIHETAALVQTLLMSALFPQQVHHAKATKSD
uniref:Uncharacterized protein n=1 Tax=viral metagenome TaxID=1070528 RepID=A0A6C0DT14_9ZZZZ